MQNFATATHSLFRRVPSLKDAQGNFFIDRNPRCFECILEYLRTGHLEAAPGVTIEALAREFDFFLIAQPPPSDKAPIGSAAPAPARSGSTIIQAKDGMHILPPAGESRVTHDIDELQARFCSKQEGLAGALIAKWPVVLQALLAASQEGKWGATLRVERKQTAANPNPNPNTPANNNNNKDNAAQFPYALSFLGKTLPGFYIANAPILDSDHQIRSFARWLALRHNLPCLVHNPQMERDANGALEVWRVDVTWDKKAA